MNRILVIRGGAIGDFVLTLPAIKLLRDHFPHAHLEILGYPHITALAENRFYAQASRSLEDGRLARFFAADAELAPDLIEYFGGFDLVVSYLFDPEQVFAKNLERCGVKIFIAGSPKISEIEHAARQLARPLEQLGFRLTNAAALLVPSTVDREFAREYLRDAGHPLVALHPGSGSESKNWPLENWREILDWLIGSGRAASVLIIGGEADRDRLSALGAALPQTTAIRFAENLPLPQLEALLERCRLFLGHDSGISHIAAAVGTECVLLFGPSDPKTWTPLNPAVRVIHSPTTKLSDLSVAEVQADLDQALLTEHAHRLSP